MKLLNKLGELALVVILATLVAMVLLVMIGIMLNLISKGLCHIDIANYYFGQPGWCSK